MTIQDRAGHIRAARAGHTLDTCRGCGGAVKAPWAATPEGGQQRETFARRPGKDQEVDLLGQCEHCGATYAWPAGRTLGDALESETIRFPPPSDLLTPPPEVIARHVCAREDCSAVLVQALDGEGEHCRHHRPRHADDEE